jgi:hypothetical protein
MTIKVRKPNVLIMYVKCEQDYLVTMVKAVVVNVFALDGEVLLRRDFTLRKTNGEVLEEHKTLAEYNIGEEDELVMRTTIAGGAKRMRVEDIPLQAVELQGREDDLPEVKLMFTLNNLNVDMWMRSLGEEKLKEYQRMAADNKNMDRIIESITEFLPFYKKLKASRTIRDKTSKLAGDILSRLCWARLV